MPGDQQGRPCWRHCRGDARPCCFFRQHAGDLGPDYWCVPVAEDLPGYHLSLVGRPGEEDAELMARLLEVWSP